MITITAVLVILFAVVFSLFRLVVPFITNYGEDIEAELSLQLGMPVDVGAVDADIAWLVPRLKLINVNLYDEKSNNIFLHFEEINLSINWFESFRYLKPMLGYISLVGLNINLERNKQGEFLIQSFKIKNDKKHEYDFVIPDELNQLLENSSIHLVDSTLRWSDQLNNKQNIVFKDVNLSLVNDAPGHTLSATMSLPLEYGEYVEFIMEIEGPLIDPLSWNGEVFVGVKDLKLEKWFDDYWQYLDFTGAGEINANIWIDWESQKAIEVNAELNAQNLALHYLDEKIHSWKLDAIRGKVRWKQYDEEWKLDVRDLDITHNKRPWPVVSAVSVISNQKENVLDIKSNFLRIEDLVHLTGLGARFVSIDGFDWNSSVAPYDVHGDLYDLNIHVPLDYLTRFKVNTDFVDFSYVSSTSVPSINGLDGALVYDGKGTVLQLDSTNVLLDFNGLFRNKISLETIMGDVGIYHDQSGWKIQSELLDLNTPHLQTKTYFEVDVPIDQPVYMDMISQFKNGKGQHKGLYLPTEIMSEGVVTWLDDALVSMDIPHGGVVYHGRFDDFPFAHNEGVFEVLFDVRNATLQYMPDWPKLENMQAEIQFYNQGMSVKNAQGSIFDARFDKTTIDIEDFNQTHISVIGEVNGPLFDMLKFVDNSSLKDVLGEYLMSFGVEGDVGIDLNIQIPVATDDAVDVTGLMLFKDNSLYLPSENYHFKNFSGLLKFNNNGAEAEKLTASLDGYPISMSIKNIKKVHASTTHLSALGYLPVKSLLSPVPIAIPYLSGDTDWKIDVYVPRSDGDKKSNIDIFVESKLQGIHSTLLGPLKKINADPLPLKLHLTISPDELNAYLKYSTDTKLSANLENEKWSINIDSPEVKGKAIFMKDLSLDIIANINLDYINVSEFSAQKNAPKSDFQASDYPPIQFYAKTLDWKDKTFSDVSLESSRLKSGMKFDYIELHAPGINIMGKGRWTKNWLHKNITKLDFNMQVGDLGQGLKALKITDSIKDTKGKASFQWKWNAEPYKFNWKILQGGADFELEDGRFADIDAGAGRLLGVLNFETIFSLDFRSQVADGFSFDDMKAHFAFSHAYAYTEDFEIESKVADIKIEGRVGMETKDYDLQLEVFPKVSNAFTAIGVATGGPILGLGIHLFQKLFGVDEAAGSSSTVTGPWSNPVVTQVDKPAGQDEKVDESDSDED